MNPLIFNKRVLFEYLIINLGMIVLIYLSRNIFSINCIFKESFGLPGPLCGFTRSISNIYTGDFLISISNHPLGIILFFAFNLYYISKIFNFKLLPSNFKTTIICFCMFTITWIIRLLFFDLSHL